MVNVVISLFSTVYIATSKPFNDPFFNGQEIFNEICILLCSYCLMFFTDNMEDPTFKYMVGWVLIGITLFNILLNGLILLKAIVTSIILLIKHLRKRCYRKKEIR